MCESSRAKFEDVFFVLVGQWIEENEKYMKNSYTISF